MAATAQQLASGSAREAKRARVSDTVDHPVLEDSEPSDLDMNDGEEGDADAESRPLPAPAQVSANAPVPMDAEQALTHTTPSTSQQPPHVNAAGGATTKPLTTGREVCLHKH